VRIAITQDGGAGELAREEIEIDEGPGFDDLVDSWASGVLEGWILSVGDTIKVIEIEGKQLTNRAMQRKLDNVEAIDVSDLERLGPYYVLREYEDGVDYCDAKLEAWVWSIGRAERTCSFMHEGVEFMVPKGMILVSLSNDLYQRPGFECLWLR
jgi:hypothetical protein